MSDTSQIRRRWGLDDETVEAIVHGRPVDARFGPLVAFAQHVGVAVAEVSGPSPTEELAAILRGDVEISRERDGMDVGRFAGIAAKVATLGAVAKIGLGTSLAAASVTGAGVVGVLPDPANDAVRGAIETVSPVDFGDGTEAEHPDNFGDDVSGDAAGDSDGENGVDGQQISEEAPGADHRPDPAGTSDEGSGQPDSTGLDRADETPAEPNAPAPSPSTVPGDGGQPEVIPSTTPSLPDQSQGHRHP
jgi:hypothetical protein